MHCMIPIFACFSSHKSIYFEVGGMRRLRSAVEWQRSDDCRAGPEIGGGFCLRFTFTAAGRGLLKSIPVFCVAAALFISLRHGGHGVFWWWNGFVVGLLSFLWGVVGHQSVHLSFRQQSWN